MVSGTRDRNPNDCWSRPRSLELVAGLGKHIVVVMMSTDVHGNLPRKSHVTQGSPPYYMYPLPKWRHPRRLEKHKKKRDKNEKRDKKD